ncbi:hypothetical protein GCK32_020413, partial [Trichostrongylus colubriformis]
GFSNPCGSRIRQLFHIQLRCQQELHK